MQESLTEGILTQGFSKGNRDLYDFGSRAVLVRQTKEALGLQENQPLPSPWTIEFELTQVCNNHCHFCSYKEMLLTQKREDLKNKWLSKSVVLDVLKAVKDGGTTKGIFWSGGGEPLLWPHIVEASEFASNFAEISLQTNGINLNKFLDRRKLSTLRLISVSVVADNNTLQKEVVGTNSFDRISSNLENIIALRNLWGINLDCNVKILVGPRNYLRVPDIVKYFREKVVVDGIAIRLTQDYNYGSSEPRQESVELTRSQKMELSKKIFTEYPDDSLLTGFTKVLNQSSNDFVTTSRCFNATDGHFVCIDPNGEAFLGNPEIGNPVFSIGNVISKSWKDIWNSNRHLEVVSIMDDMQSKGSCDSYLCRHTRANIGVDRFLRGEKQALPEEQVMTNLGAFL